MEYLNILHFVILLKYYTIKSNTVIRQQNTLMNA
jgi:hypothetical protein